MAGAGFVLSLAVVLAVGRIGGDLWPRGLPDSTFFPIVLAVAIAFPVTRSALSLAAHGRAGLAAVPRAAASVATIAAVTFLVLTFPGSRSRTTAPTSAIATTRRSSSRRCSGLARSSQREPAPCLGRRRLRRHRRPHPRRRWTGSRSRTTAHRRPTPRLRRWYRRRLRACSTAIRQRTSCPGMPTPNADRQQPDEANWGPPQHGGGPCVLTTACVTALGKPDDCHELQMFRRLRDDHLLRTAEGRAVIEDYYRSSPHVVAAIEAGSDAAAVTSITTTSWHLSSRSSTRAGSTRRPIATSRGTRRSRVATAFSSACIIDMQGACRRPIAVAVHARRAPATVSIHMRGLRTTHASSHRQPPAGASDPDRGWP